MDNSKRDRSIEALLRRRIDEDAPLREQCVDPESLAAWVDGGLAASERAIVEKHAAGCTRCQALLASIARTEPEVQPQRWWQSVTAKWLVPLAAAATALVIWTTVGQSPVPVTVPQPAADTARVAPAPPPARPDSSPAAATPPASSDRRAEEPAPKAAERDTRTRDELGRRDREKALQQSAKLEPRQMTAPSAGTALADKKVDAIRPQDQAAANTASALAAAAPAPTSPAAPTSPNAKEVAPPEAKPVAPGGVAESVTVTSEAPRAATFVAGRAVAGGLAAVATDIQSPDASYRWRIVPPAGVQRSTDGGASWAVVDPLPASIRGSNGAPGVLTAGSSPTRDVCWIVGRGGVVLLSINGATWQRRPFPEAIDLVGVRASSASNAIVTSADGRQFTSTDGGSTWTPVK